MPKRNLKSLKRALSKQNSNAETPPRKRQKLSRSPSKLSDEEQSRLPQLRNPKFFKHIYQSWQTFVSKDDSRARITSPKIALTKIETGTRCTMVVSKCNRNGDPITITEDHASKAKSEVLAWRSLVLSCIPFDILCELMLPWSSKPWQRVASAASESKTSEVSVEVFPLPLRFSEADCVAMCEELADGVQPNRVDMSREDNFAICQKALMQFDDSKSAQEVVDAFKQHGEFMDVQGFEARMEFSSETSAPIWKTLAGKTTCIMLSGFLLNLDHEATDYNNESQVEKKMLTYMQENGINSGAILDHSVQFRYSTVGLMFARFRSKEDATQQMDAFIASSRNNLWTHNGITSRIYARYALKTEVDERIDLVQTLNEVPRVSDSVDVSNIQWEVSTEELRGIFTAVGTVASCHVFPRKDLFPSRAFVRFDTVNGGLRAIQKLNGKLCRGLRLKVSAHQRMDGVDRKARNLLKVLKEQDDAEKRKKFKVEQRMKAKMKNRKRKIRKRLSRISKRQSM